MWLKIRCYNILVNVDNHAQRFVALQMPTCLSETGNCRHSCRHQKTRCVKKTCCESFSSMLPRMCFSLSGNKDLNWMSKTTFKGKTEPQMLKLWNVIEFFVLLKCNTKLLSMMLLVTVWIEYAPGSGYRVQAAVPLCEPLVHQQVTWSSIK